MTALTPENALPCLRRLFTTADETGLPSTRLDDEPHDSLVRLYADDPLVRPAIDQAVEVLLSEIHLESNTCADFISRLLDFIQGARIIAARPLLWAIVLKRPPLLEQKGLYRHTLRIAVLGTLASLPPGSNPEFWIPHLTDPAVAATAFAGLANEDFDTALKRLPFLLATADKPGGEAIPLDSSILLLVARLRAREESASYIVLSIMARARLATLPMRRRVYDALAALRSVAPAAAKHKNVLLPEDDEDRVRVSFSQRMWEVVVSSIKPRPLYSPLGAGLVEVYANQEYIEEFRQLEVSAVIAESLYPTTGIEESPVILFFNLVRQRSFGTIHASETSSELLVGHNSSPRARSILSPEEKELAEELDNEQWSKVVGMDTA